MKLTFNSKASGGGLTLAEVLVTLGIIGVVAAMTLPVLTANYKKTVLVTQLKKEINTLSNNFKKIMADEQIYKLSDTSIFDGSGSINADAYKNYFNANYADENSKFGEYISSTFSRDINGREVKGMYFNDGSCFAFTDDYEAEIVNGGGYIDMSNSILVDVNCDKKPNRIGMDIFLVDYDDTGVHHNYFAGGDTASIDSACSQLIAMEKDMGDEYAEDGAYFVAAGGRLCLQSIIKHGWKMVY